MDKVTLVGAIGFKEELVRRPAEILKATRLVLLATPHVDVKATREQLEAWAKNGGVRMEVIQLKTSYDFVAWFRQWNKALEKAGPEVYVNLTAGHAVAISTAGIVAMKQNVPCVCWDHLEDELHHLSPSILLRLDELIPRDEEALRILVKGPMGIGEIAQAMGDKPSTTTRTLQRLETNGFLVTRADSKDSRRRVAQLRPGVRAFLGSVTG